MSKSNIRVREAELIGSKDIIPAASVFDRIALPLPSADGFHAVQAVASAFGRTYVGVASHPSGYGTAGRAALYSCRLSATRVEDWREHWQMPIESRYVEVGNRSRLIALEFGFASLVGDTSLLVAAVIDRMASRLLVSTDGKTFGIEPNPPAPAAERAPFQHMALTNAGLFASPAGGTRSAGIRLYCRVPKGSGALSPWVALQPPIDGDGRHITCLASSEDCLYVGIACPAQGFEFWRLDPASSEQVRWQCLLDRGALRHTANTALTAVAPDGHGGFWLGTGGGENGPVGDEGAEILFLSASGDWEIGVGEARFSPKGLKLPTSCCGPGVDDHSYTHVRALHAHRANLLAALAQKAKAGARRPADRAIVCALNGGAITNISPMESAEAEATLHLRGFVDSGGILFAFGTQFDDSRETTSSPALWRFNAAVN